MVDQIIRRVIGSPMALLLLVLSVCAGCTLSPGGEQADLSAVRADLMVRLAETQAAQTQALALWDRLIDGEAVPCTEALPALSVVTLSSAELRVHTQAATVQDALNTAIRALRTSADLWDSECAQVRDTVPLTTARDGRAAAVAAAEPLSTAAALLASW